MRFPKRLKEIVKFIKAGSFVGDVGADHGLLELLLIATYKPITIQAIENKKGPYEILKSRVGALDEVYTSFSDGITALSPEVDTLVIAGMGGINICSILSKRSNKLTNVKSIIIDAHRDVDLARGKIVSLGYEIESEKIVKEKGIYYTIILFNKITYIKKYTKNQLKYGVKLYEDPLWNEYKNHLIGQHKKVIEIIKDKPECAKQLKKLNNEIERLENYGKNEAI